LKASGGTLFLDEVGDLPPALQPKLLRALQERRVRPVGGDEEMPIDVRLICATNRDLEAAIEEERFREDLYFRVNVIQVAIPPLRARGGDVLILAQHFVDHYAARAGKRVTGISPEAAQRLVAYPWPGNVRELQNFIERLVVLSDGEALTAADVMRELARRPPIVSTGDAPAGDRLADGDGAGAGTLEAKRRDAEREAIITALAKSGNNRVQAARLLGISRRGLYHKLGEYGLL